MKVEIKKPLAIIEYQKEQNFPWIAKDGNGNTIQTYGKSVACKTKQEAKELAIKEGYEVVE